MIELQPDNNYSRVSCPACGHQWHQEVHGMGGVLARVSGLHCPSCGMPLKLPSPEDYINSRTNDEPKSKLAL